LTSSFAEIKSLTASADMLTLEGIAPDTLIVLAVPYRGTPRGTSVTVRISVDYWTEKRASLKRALRKATTPGTLRSPPPLGLFAAGS
jgi:hypothetical protein